jgi:hypothetical protein
MGHNNQIDSAAANSAESLAKLRQEIEIREEFLAFREKELIPLREEISNFRLRYLQISAGIALIIAVLSILGYDKWSDLNSKIDTVVADRVQHKVDETVQPEINKSIRYAEELRYALGLTDIPNATEQAMALLEKLASQRRQNELPFCYLTECYMKLDRCHEGYLHLKDLKNTGVLKSEELKMPLSLRNYGFILWIESLYDQSNPSDALSIVHKSLMIAKRTGANEDIRASAEYMVLMYLSRGERSLATYYATSYLKNYNPNWQKYRDKRWFKKLRERSSDIESNLREMFPGSFTAAKTASERK